MKLIGLLSVLFLFQSCVDVFKTSLCENYITADDLVGKYTIDLMGEKSSGKIEKTENGYLLSSLDLGDDMKLNFKVCELTDGRFMEVENMNYIQISDLENSSYKLEGVSIDKDILDSSAIDYEIVDDEFGIETKVVENKVEDRNIIIQNFSLAPLSIQLIRQ